MGIGMNAGDYENQGEKDAQLGHERFYKEADQRWSARAYTRGYNRFLAIREATKQRLIMERRGKSLVLQMMQRQLIARNEPKPDRKDLFQIWVDELQ